MAIKINTELSKKKVDFINASVSGVEAVAIGGTLSIVVGGAKNILDIDKLLSAISGAAAGSWQMKNRLEAVHQREFNFGFAIKWMVKYFSYALNKANKNNLNLELTKNVYNKYQQLIKNGKENYDISALILHRDK